MRYQRIPSFALLFLLLTTSTAAFAQQAKIGRLPDGRAYRMDPSGFQLSDEFAELQVTVGEQERQIEALQNELARLRHGGAPGTKLPEAPAAPRAELPPATSGSTGDTANTALVQCQTRLSAQQEQLASLQRRPEYCPAQAPSRCEEAERPLREQIASLQRRPEYCPAPVACRCDEELRPLHEQLAALQTALAAAPTRDQLQREKSGRETLTQSLSSATNDLAKANSLLDQQAGHAAAQDHQIAELSRQTSELTRQLGEAQTKLAHGQQREEELLETIEKCELKAQDAEGRRLAQKDERVPVVQLERTSPAAPEADLTQIRAQLNKVAAEIQQLVIQRKDLYDTVHARKTGVTVPIQPLVAANGLSLDALRAKIRQVTTPEEISAVSSGLQDIRRILTEDIQVLQRLNKL